MSALQTTDQRIVIVDDKPKSIRFIGKVLRENGHLVSVAESGSEALEIIEQNPPDLILLDVLCRTWMATRRAAV